MQWSGISSLAPFAAATTAAAAVGSQYGPGDAATRDWYAHLDKPSFTPPAAVFPVVWTALYAATAVSGWLVWREGPSHRRRVAIGLWAGQLGLNASWSPLFFGRRRPDLSLVDVVSLLGTLAAYTWAANRVSRTAAVLSAPYLAWTAFAAVLNLEIARRNPQESDK